MKRCIVIGKPNVGKTVFVIRLAASLGASKLEMTMTDPSGEQRHMSFTVDEGIEKLSGAKPHETLRLQSLKVELPVGKGVKRFTLMDTSGLIDGIHQDARIRHAMAQTLAVVRDAHVIFHMMDADEAGREGPVKAIGDVDYQVAQFAQVRDHYLILANKMDLPAAGRGLERIRREFPGHPVVAVSALHGQGLKEVTRYVRRWI